MNDHWNSYIPITIYLTPYTDSAALLNECIKKFECVVDAELNWVIIFHWYKSSVYAKSDIPTRNALKDIGKFIFLIEIWAGRLCPISLFISLLEAMCDHW